MLPLRESEREEAGKKLARIENFNLDRENLKTLANL